MLEQIQRDLFALGARLADPAQQDRGTGDQGGSHLARHRAAGSVDRPVSNPSCRRFGDSSWQADLRPVRRCTSRALCADAPNARSSPSAPKRSSRNCSSTSIGSRTCCLSWRARPTVAPERRKSSGERDCRPEPAPGSRRHIATANVSRGSTTRTSRLPRPCCRRRCARISPRSMRSPAAPTISPTSPVPIDERLRLLDAWGHASIAACRDRRALRPPPATT